MMMTKDDIINTINYYSTRFQSTLTLTLTPALTPYSLSVTGTQYYTPLTMADENGRKRSDYSASPTYKPALSPSMQSGTSPTGSSSRAIGEDGLTLRRREANRLAAQRFRSRKKGYQDSLEERIRILEEEKDLVARHGYLNYPRSTSPDKSPMDLSLIHI